MGKGSPERERDLPWVGFVRSLGALNECSRGEDLERGWVLRKAVGVLTETCFSASGGTGKLGQLPLCLEAVPLGILRPLGRQSPNLFVGDSPKSQIIHIYLFLLPLLKTEHRRR